MGELTTILNRRSNGPAQKDQKTMGQNREQIENKEEVQESKENLIGKSEG